MAIAAIEILVAAEVALRSTTPLRMLRVTSRDPPAVLGSYADGGFATWAPETSWKAGGMICSFCEVELAIALERGVNLNCHFCDWCE